MYSYIPFYCFFFVYVYLIINYTQNNIREMFIEMFKMNEKSRKSNTSRLTCFRLAEFISLAKSLTTDLDSSIVEG